MGKRYYWLKLKEDFFDSKRIKKLRRVAGGDTFTIIYLKMQLKAMRQDGMLHYDGLEASPAEELALDLDEDVENVQFTLNYLLSCGLAETSDNTAFFLPYSIENTGSEGASAQRMRDLRARQEPQKLPEKAHASLCDISVTERKRKIEEKDIDIESDREKEGSGGKENPTPNLLSVGLYGNVLLTRSDLERLQKMSPYADAIINRLSVQIFNGKVDRTDHAKMVEEYLTKSKLGGSL